LIFPINFARITPNTFFIASTFKQKGRAYEMSIGTLLLRIGGGVFIFYRAYKGHICISFTYLDLRPFAGLARLKK
jgi:hypothetical protein